MKKIFLFGFISAFALILFLNACIQQENPEMAGLVGLNAGSNLSPQIQCNDKCDGTTYYLQGKAENGNCVYESKEENSAKCGYVPTVNACENISCEGKCDGSAWQSNGSCSEGKCVYANEIPESVKCKYDFDVFVQDCYYLGPPDNEFGIFLTIKNLGNEETKGKESIWLKGLDGKMYSYYYLNYNYGKNRVLFDRIKWNGIIIKWRRQPYQGLC